PTWENFFNPTSIKYRKGRPRFTGQLYAAITKERKIIYNQNSQDSELYNLINDRVENQKILEDDKSLFEVLKFWISENPLGENHFKQNEYFYNTLKDLGYL